VRFSTPGPIERTTKLDPMRGSYLSKSRWLLAMFIPFTIALCQSGCMTEMARSDWEWQQMNPN
jgi:hypothetical protein